MGGDEDEVGLEKSGQEDQVKIGSLTGNGEDDG